MNQIYQLAFDFRLAMDRAKKAGIFDHVMGFNDFPHGSCGDTCYLLAQYLLEHEIYTEYVCGMKWPQSHAWLVVARKEELLRKRAEYSNTMLRIGSDDETNGYENMLQFIQIGSNRQIEYTEPDYVAELHGRVIIDITGDQFSSDEEFLYYDKPVYVGEMDEMHALFEIDSISECMGLSGVGDFNSVCFYNLYQKIKQFL